MTKPRSAAGAVIHTGELAGRAAQQPAGAPKTTGAATTIQGHWSGRAESHEGIVSGSIGANPRSHQGNGTIWAIHGAATTNARFNTTKASPRREGGNASAGHGASAPAIVAASARVRGTLSGLNDAPVTTTAAANAATHASTGRRASRAAAEEERGADGPAGGVVEPEPDTEVVGARKLVGRGETGGRDREDARENE